jgi:glycosyltransferase involved in cell wall biosynthesis
MRILVTSDQWFPDYRGGSARVATETALRLAARDHEVVVVAPEAPGEPRLEERGSLSIHRVVPRGRAPITLLDPVATRRFIGRLDGRFDVAVSHQCTNAFGVASARPRLPLALVVHASALRELRFDRAHAGIVGKARRLALEPALAGLERRASRRADRLLVLSEFTRSLIAEDRPDRLSRVVRVSGGVDVDRFRPLDDRQATRSRLGLERERPVLFSARRLAPRMGLESLLAAFARIGRDALLVIAGTGPLYATLRRLAVDLGVAENVRFLGNVSDGDLVEWYGAADLFVLPTVAYEGFGMATAEALAAGLPVVGTPIGATPELLETLDARLVSEGTDPGSLARAIVAALDRVGEELRQRCRDYAVTRLSWEVVIPGWEAALEETIRGASRLERVASYDSAAREGVS